MKRREFITLFGGAAAWPVVARAQQGERIRRIGVLMPLAADDPQSPVRTTAFLKGLQQLGWIDGRNVRIDYRWAVGDAEHVRQHAAELIALAPDVIVAWGASTMGQLKQTTRTIPVVFAALADPVGAGFVDGMARPGGNATGFMLFEYSMSGKWLELLKEIAPIVTRAAYVWDPANPVAGGLLKAIQAAAPSLGMEISTISLRDASEIERSMEAFAQSPNGALVVGGGPLAAQQRELIIMLAGRHRLPAIYSERFFVGSGGLLSYGPDQVDQLRRSAAYVDRILKGETPADLPVQAPTKFEMAINLKTAKALGLTVPPTLLARADEVIE